MKKFLRVLVVAICVWVLLFQGTSFSPVEELGNVQSIKQVKVLPAVSGEIIMLRFAHFVVILWVLMYLLHSYFYDRQSVVSGRI